VESLYGRHEGKRSRSPTLSKGEKTERTSYDRERAIVGRKGGSERAAYRISPRPAKRGRKRTHCEDVRREKDIEDDRGKGETGPRIEKNTPGPRAITKKDKEKSFCPSLNLGREIKKKKGRERKKEDSTQGGKQEASILWDGGGGGELI